MARKVSYKQWLLYGIALSGIVEAVIAIGQKLHWLNSFHSIFDITGTFGNPGPLGGYLAIVIIILWGFYWKYYRNSLLKWFLLGIIVFLLVAIVLTDSRAAWLAILMGIGGFYLLNKEECGHLVILTHKMGITVFLFLFIASLYYYKKDSADGRLLIWRVSAGMIVDAPLFGHGIGNFEKEYMYYQAQYFESHSYSRFIRLADNVAYPYNEFLRIGVEYGLVGLILILCILGAVVRYAIYRRENRIYLSMLVSWITFSIFSYSSKVLLLWLLLPLILGGMQYENSRSFFVGYKYRLVEWIMGLLCLFFVTWNGYAYWHLRENIKKLYASSTIEREDAKVYIEQHQKELHSVPRLFDIYAQYICQKGSTIKKIQVLEEATIIIPNSELFCDLGDVYKELGQLDKAVECYILAGNMVPNRLLPNYKLFCLYHEIRDTIRMKEVGSKALNLSIKLESTRTLRMRGEIQQILGQ